MGARAGACQSVAIFHQSVGGMAGPAGRPASGAHFVPGPGRHRSPAPLTSLTTLERAGRHIPSPAQAPAGTKRLSNLLRSPNWSHTLLEKFLWHRAEQCLTRLEQQGRTALAIWDESVLEKPESIADSSIRRACARFSPARRHASSASSRATTILPVGRRCSCPACSGSPSWWPGCRGLPAWPPCAGGPAGAIWPVADRNRPHRYSPSALKAGRSGWSTSSTGDIPGYPSSGSWEYIKPGSSCAGPPAIAWPTGRANVPPFYITRGKRSQGYHQIWDTRRRQYRKTGIVAASV